MFRSVPPQHQTDPAKMPGQIINRELREPHEGHRHTAHCPSSCWKDANHDMMDDMALHAMMNPPKQDKAVGDYARRKSDSEGMTIQRGGSMRHVPADAYKPTHGGYPTPRETELRSRAFNATDVEFKPCRDLPQEWDHV